MAVPPLTSLDRQVRRDEPLPRGLVYDVDSVVLPVRTRNSGQHRQPADRAEASFFCERAVEDERPAVAAVVAPLDLRDAVQEDLELCRDVRRYLDPRFRGAH